MNKAASILLFILVISNSGKSQTIDDSLLRTMYTKHINYSFDDSFLNAQQKKYGYILVQSDLKQDRKINNEENKLLIASDTSSFHKFMINPYSKNTGRVFISISHKQIAQDTIDIYHSHSTVISAIETKGKRRNKSKISKTMSISSSRCKGTCDYIADGRFIYSYDEKKWIYYTFINRCTNITVKRVD